MGAWFFFSYARQDRDDRLDRFYKELSKNVRLAKQLREDETAFFDQRSIEVGDVWTEKLREGLRTARVLVAICAPAYLASEYCGKELQACIDRIPAGAQSTAIFPVIWGMPEASQHPAFGQHQFTPAALPPPYKSEGLYSMMGPEMFHNDYEQFVTKLGRKIAEAGEKRSLLEATSLPPFDKIRNPFAKAAKAAGSSMKHALFSYVAGRKHELPGDVSDRYGDDGKEWRPFHPDFPEPVG